MKSKRLLTLAVCILLMAALLGTSAYAVGYNYPEIEKEVEDYKYPVPDGLPVVDVDSWQFRLANSYNSIGMYGSENCDTTCPTSFFFGQGIDSRIYEKAVAFVQDAQQAGYLVYLNTAKRTYEFNLTRWQTMIELVYGDANTAAKSMLQPGCDDHQTSLAIDLTDNAYYADNYQGEHDQEFGPGNPTYDYLASICADYGFIVRYPEGKEQYYGVKCCPGHFRYVGEEAAKYIMENNLCLEEFLMLYGYPVNLPSE